MQNRTQTYAQLTEKFGLLADEPMKRRTSFRVGGPADLFAEPKSVEVLTALIAAARQHQIPVTLIGSGTNLLVSDLGIRGMVITTRRLKTGIRVLSETGSQALVRAGAGERLAAVCRFAADNGLSGLEFSAGIPGTVGGAVIMNAGTPKGCMGNIIDQVTLLNRQTLEIHSVGKEEINFKYRDSGLNGIVLASVLCLEKAEPPVIRQAMDNTIENKKHTQPISAASAGCFFKNPVAGKPAGQLIEEAGLKGKRINDAQVSTVHANYIVNLANASCKDILELQQQVQKTVMDKFNIKLEVEVRVEGE